MQRIFEDHAQEYFEYGLQPIPTKPFVKACMIPGYDKDFYEKKLTQEVLDKYIKSHGHWDLGIVCGEMSGVIGIDFDFEGYNDSKFLENMLIGALPPTPAIKKGAKGWTRFYKYSEVFASTRSLKRFVPELGVEKTFLDILSNKKITIMPPSRHKDGSNLLYEWVGTKHLIDCLEDLPELTIKDLELIEKVWKFDISSVEKERPSQNYLKNRHDKIFGFVMRKSEEVETIDELINLTFNFDINENSKDPKGPYFQDPKYAKRKEPIEACKDLVTRLCNWKEKNSKEKGIEWSIGQGSTSFWINIGSEEKPKWARSESFKDFSRFFAMRYPTARKDFMSHVVHYKNSYGLWIPVENEIESLKSFSHEVGLNQAHVKANLDRWCLSMKERPLFDIKPWDGRDHIGEAVKYIKFKNIDEDVAVDIFKEWFSGIFRRLKDPSKANRLIILRGKQGKGKDWWVNFVLSAFGSQHGEISINPKNKIENFTTLYNLVTGYISEFDETKGVPIGMLKSLITSRSAMFRLPYDKRAQNRLLRYSLIASVNDSDVLRDTTGNRRFIIFDIDEIDWSYREKLNPQMMLNQAYQLYLDGYKSSSDSESVIKEIIDSETPVSSEELFVEELVALLKDKTNDMRLLRDSWSRSENLSRAAKEIVTDNYKIRWKNIASEITKIAKNYGFHVQKAQKIIKKRGFKSKDRSGPFYFLPEKYVNNV